MDFDFLEILILVHKSSIETYYITHLQYVVDLADEGTLVYHLP